MKLSFIVTIDPVKEKSLLDIAIHAFNMQDSTDFNVIFYNQNRKKCVDIIRDAAVAPKFPFMCFDVEETSFFGAYPLWDLYAFHAMLLDRGHLNDYFMSLHMEEFLGPDYVRHALSVLGENRFDIMFGNLSRTRSEYGDVAPLLIARTPQAFDGLVKRMGLDATPHWGFSQRQFSRAGFKKNLTVRRKFSLTKNIRPTPAGYFRRSVHRVEDVYFMSREFALRHNWFLKGHRMYFEDIHICNQKGICELPKELSKITNFPVYFNKSKVFHVNHGKLYYQFEDRAFSDGLLAMKTDDPILTSLKTAIRHYRANRMNLTEALLYSRRNPEQTGSQNMNWRYHMRYLAGGPASPSAVADTEPGRAASSSAAILESSAEGR